MPKILKSARKGDTDKLRKVKTRVTKQQHKLQRRSPIKMVDLERRRAAIIREFARTNASFQRVPGDSGFNVFMEILKVAPLVDLDALEASAKKGNNLAVVALDETNSVIELTDYESEDS